MRLRTAVPDEWDLFTQALRNYAATTTAEMVKADPALLLRAQGRAQMAHEISMLLTQAPTLSEQYREKQQRERLRGGRPSNQFANGY